MTDTFEFTLNNPLTEEQWDMITDVDFDLTDHVTFHTKHGKEVEFIKVIRCENCRWFINDDDDTWCVLWAGQNTNPDAFCSYAKPKERGK